MNFNKSIQIPGRIALFNPKHCPSRSALAAYAENSLSARERAVVAGHLAKCAECREEIALIARIGVLLQHATVVPDSPFLHQRIMAQIEREAQPAPVLRPAFRVASALTLAACAATFALFYLHRTETRAEVALSAGTIAPAQKPVAKMVAAVNPTSRPDTAVLSADPSHRRGKLAVPAATSQPRVVIAARRQAVHPAMVALLPRRERHSQMDGIGTQRVGRAVFLQRQQGNTPQSPSVAMIGIQKPETVPLDPVPFLPDLGEGMRGGRKTVAMVSADREQAMPGADSVVSASRSVVDAVGNARRSRLIFTNY